MSVTLLILIAIYGACANKDIYRYTYASLGTDGLFCFGDCFNGLCADDWWGHMKTCRQSHVVSPIYKTINAKDCYSNCGRFNAEDYSWCATWKDNSLSWDRCSRDEARTATKRIQTDNILYTCKDDCKSRGSSYNWCHTHNSWEKCDPEHWVLVFNYPTNQNTKCETRCVSYSDKYYCYDTNNKWVECYFNPDKSLMLDEFRHGINDALQHYGDFFEDGYKVCSDSASKKKRAINSQWPYISSVADLVAEFESGFPTIRPNDGGPVQSYTVLPITNPGGDDTILPLGIRAVITRAHLPRPRTRGNIPTTVTRNIERMHPYRARADRNNDERGHLLAHNLGGPMETWNFLPQPRSFNRGQESRWYYLEMLIAEFLRGRAGRRVEWLAALAYDVYSDRPTRPISVTMTARLYEEDGTLNVTRGSFEDLYFSNDPSWSCRTFVGGSTSTTESSARLSKRGARRKFHKDALGLF